MENRMASRELTVNISATEVPQYRRLVDFLYEIENLGRVNADEEIQALVAAAREDLAALGSSRG